MILLIDNYDSFTYNLVQYLGELGAEVSVKRNDLVSLSDIKKDPPTAVIISPGPCNPDKAGICLELTRMASNENIPVFGVCLGHQTIGQVFGGKITAAKSIMHGKTSSISHNAQGVFKGIPSPFRATRYHSLIVSEKNLPDCLQITARIKDGTIMGLQHKTKPIYGVQFHPESIASEYGHLLLKNFLAKIRDHND
ncbi:MAG: aminodeoxychorismate/anthranilate synthase component II [Pseudomonadota bacterium]|nr:aminodeoxychorismate/anthranilate synthase component II [Pseudomonadota bacterium]